MGYIMVDGDCPQGEVCLTVPHPGHSRAWWLLRSLLFLKIEGLYIESAVDDLANLITLTFPITVPELTLKALYLVQCWYTPEKLSVQTTAETGLLAKSKKVDGFVENVLLNGVILRAGSVRYLIAVLDAALN
jgi:hypothetical protein